jgi:DUF1009 family protein
MKDLKDIHSGITRDNASSNDTLLKAFIKYYNQRGLKFEGDIPCIAHVLNLIIQDILKTLIKNDYDTSYNRDIYEVEEEEDEEDDIIDLPLSK